MSLRSDHNISQCGVKCDDLAHAGGWLMGNLQADALLTGGRTPGRRGRRTHILHAALLVNISAGARGRCAEGAQAARQGGAFSLFWPLFLFTNGARVRRVQNVHARTYTHTHSNSNNNSCISAYKTRGATFIRTDIACMTKMKWKKIMYGKKHRHSEQLFYLRMK